jgi:hypothetical protein
MCRPASFQLFWQTSRIRSDESHAPRYRRGHATATIAPQHQHLHLQYLHIGNSGICICVSSISSISSRSRLSRQPLANLKARTTTQASAPPCHLTARPPVTGLPATGQIISPKFAGTLWLALCQPCTAGTLTAIVVFTCSHLPTNNHTLHSTHCISRTSLPRACRPTFPRLGVLTSTPLKERRLRMTRKIVEAPQ